MMMTAAAMGDFDLIRTLLPGEALAVAERLPDLHHVLRRRLRELNFDLYPHWDKQQIITPCSAASPYAEDGVSMVFGRSVEQAVRVERLMGRDGRDSLRHADMFRHPVIEVRATPREIAVELIISPSAWWDQRNLIGKLGVARHRDGLRGLIESMDERVVFGFWEGTARSEMYLTAHEIVQRNVLSEWMGTFSDGQDYLRVGVWYTPASPEMGSATFTAEITRRVCQLYPLYQFALWTSNNNFQDFYRLRATARAKRLRN